MRQIGRNDIDAFNGGAGNPRPILEMDNPPASLPADTPAGDGSGSVAQQVNDQRQRGLSGWLTGQLRRLLTISASLISTYVITGALGLVFWAIATWRFSIPDVGVAGAAVALQTLLGGLGNLGMGTLLISKLPQTPQEHRRVLVRSSMLVTGVASFALTLLVSWTMANVFRSPTMLGVAGSWWGALILAVGTALTSVAVVLDQAVLVLGVGSSVQFQRNALASVTKVIALLLLSPSLGGMAIFAAWSIGTAVSLPLVAWRTRGGRSLEHPANPTIDLGVVRGHARAAASNYGLNTILMVPLQMLPIIVGILLSARDNGLFTATLRISEFVFVMPYALSIGLFAVAEGNIRSVLRQMRVTLPMTLGICVAAVLVALFGAPLILRIFGTAYSQEAATVLRLMIVASVGFAIKDHFVALRRVQERTGPATLFFLAFTVFELSLAAFGARLGGLVTMVTFWLVAIGIQAVVMSLILYREVLAAGVLTADDEDHPQRGAAGAARTDTDELGPARPGVVENDLVRSHPPTGDKPGAPAGATLPLMIRAYDEQLAPAASGPLVEARLAAPVARDEVPPAPLPASAPTVPTALAEREAGAGVHPESNDAGDLAGSPTRRQTAPDDDEPTPSLRMRSRMATAGPGPYLAAMAAGLVLFSVGIWLGRSGNQSAGQVAYVAGLAVMFIPAALAATLPGLIDHQRRWVALALLPMLQFCRVIQQPRRFADHDELAHATNLRHLLEQDHLYSANPILPVTAYYPGLATITGAVQQLTGLSAHTSALVVTMAARIMLAVAIYGLIRTLTKSERAAAAGVVVYACSPQILIFNSQYSYQTLALPLALLAIFLVARRTIDGLGGLLVPAAVTFVMAMTHHLTSVLVCALWAGWLVLVLLLGRGEPNWVGRIRDLFAMLLATVAGIVAALMIPGNTTLEYVVQAVQSALSGASSLLERGETKTLFVNPGGVASSMFERGLMLAAVAITGLALVAAWWRSREWLRHRRNRALPVLLVLVSLLFVLQPLGHLAQSTGEIADRSTTFAFIGIAFVLGWWIWQRAMTRRVALIATALATVTFLGGVMLGSGPLVQQVPGQHWIGADARSIDRYNLGAVDWMTANVAQRNSVFGNRVGMLLASADGGFKSATEIGTGKDASELLLNPAVTAEDLKLIRTLPINFLISDLRDASALPTLGFYVADKEWGQDMRRVPVPRSALRKFDRVSGASRVYTNGPVTVYELNGAGRGGN